MFDLNEFIAEQIQFSIKAFGPGDRTNGVVDHIEKELDEIIKSDGQDLSEWIDVIILALDGAWRAGHTPIQITTALRAKFDKNKLRKWPDWRTADPNKAIEHVRDE